MPSGGYRKPEKPAAVSGPGKYSARTDGQPGTQPIRSLPDAGYGEQQQFQELQRQAPLPDSQGQPAPSSVPQGGGGPQVTPLTAPSERPNQPVTAGVDAGEGPGSEILAPPAPTSQDVQRLAQWLPLLEPHARSSESSQPFRLLVRFIQNQASMQQTAGQGPPQIT